MAVLRAKADVVHIYKPTPLTIVGLLARLKRRAKLVVDLDDLGASVMRREGQSPALWAIVAMCERVCASMCDGLIVASTFLEQKYGGLSSGRVIWIPNGVTGIRTIPHGNQPRVVFVGSMNSPDVLDMLLDQVEETCKLAMRRVEYVIIGDGTHRARLEADAALLAEVASIRFCGWVDNAALGKFLRAGDLGFYCVPDTDAYAAASSQKVFDYMSMGIVPVVNDVGDLAAYVEHGRAGYVARVEAVPAVIAEALSDVHGRRNRSACAQRVVAEKYLWSGHAARVQDFYEQLKVTA
ncbi:hypothetical protein acdb102_19470 [Acidothermaceae bacterium B102]|nr:hypothetical protein acdb102_19470 [Acidothermaceae bacterium B102]